MKENRNTFKTLAKTHILLAYNISPQATKQENHDKIKGLLDAARFIYKVIFISSCNIID